MFKPTTGGTRNTPQSEAIPGRTMVQNRGGGFVFEVDKWERLRRFLILGSEGGTYYAGETELTKESVEGIIACYREDRAATVEMIKDVSLKGSAPKNDFAIYALAACAGAQREDGKPDVATRQLALRALTDVCRTGTHLFQFVDYVKQFRGWGQSLQQAIQNYYLHTPLRNLTFQVLKYQNRVGWSHRDLLRKSRPKVTSAAANAAGRRALFDYLVRGLKDMKEDANELMVLVSAFEQAKTAEKAQLINLIKEYELTREMVPTQFLDDKDVVAALFEKQPLHAMVRNLGQMSKIGLMTPGSQIARQVATKLGDRELIRRSRLHPMAILIALKVYAQGHGFLGKGTWTAVPGVIDALDEAFYLAFDNVTPTGKHLRIAIDGSGSMTCAIQGGRKQGGSPLDCRQAATALALVIAHTEPSYEIVGFNDRVFDLPITKKDTLRSAISTLEKHVRGTATDVAAPILGYTRTEAEGFVTLTDNETWKGKIHPTQALAQYRERSGKAAKFVSVGMATNSYSVADPGDAGQMNVVGFDASAPPVIADFLRS